MASIERDDLADGFIVWIPLSEAATFHLFPAVGELLGELQSNTAVTPRILTTLTDKNFKWV
jgi:hypothetical protein